MTRIEAALDDLGRLAGDGRDLDAELRALAPSLQAALDVAWTTSGSFLGARPRLEDELLAHLRAADATADGVEGAARRLRLAGGDGTLSVVPLGGSAAAGRLAVVVAAQEGGRAAAGVWSWLRGAFIRPAGPAAYVVSTETRTYGMAAWSEVSVTYRRDELSDGSVAITEVRGASIATGFGAGAACGVAVDGEPLLEGAAGGDVGVGGAASRTWRFGSTEAADRWWDAQRDDLLASALGWATPVIGPGISLAGSLRDRILGQDEALRPDASSTEASLTGALRASFGGPAGGVLAALGGSATVRRNDDGTTTLVVDNQVEATAELRLGDAPGGGPAATVQGSMTTELTVADDGELRAVALQLATLAPPGLDPFSGQPVAPVVAPAGLDALHVYETTMTLDLTDADARDLLAAGLGLDASTTGGAAQAALAAIAFDPAAVRAAELTVLERTRPDDDGWQVGCDFELPVLQGSAGLSAGTTTQRTVSAWRKEVGGARLAPLGG